MKRQISAHAQPIWLLNGQLCHQTNASWADSREWSPLQDLLYSQPGSSPLASGQQSDGWRDGGAVESGEEVSINQWQAERCQDGR